MVENTVRKDDVKESEGARISRGQGMQVKGERETQREREKTEREKAEQRKIGTERGR